MARLALLGGAYQARSIIANAQRCLNLFPEINPKDSPVPVTHYQRPGFKALVSGPAATVRGLYRASDGQGFCVIGQGVYYISPGWVLTQLGALDQIRSNQVSFTDNGVTVLLVDGSPFGYTISLGSHAFGKLVDPTGIFQGSIKVDIIDGFMLWVLPQSNLFGVSLNAVVTAGAITFDSTFVAGKNDFPDQLETLIVNRHEILLIGSLKTEIWYDAGNTTFPMAELPGAYFEHGTVAPYSVAAQDISVYWLGQDLQGQGVVFRARGYQCTRISNHALEYQLRVAANKTGISDAIGYTYQQDGHVFYVLILPSAGETWVFDEASQEWHQRGWTDPKTGAIGRDRSNCAAFLYGANVVGDWENGTLYALDLDTYVDQVGGIDCPIQYVRSFPHITEATPPGAMWPGQLIPSNGHQFLFTSFQADLEPGMAPLVAPNQPPQVTLRVSRDRGRTWETTALQSSGATGEYDTWPLWRAMGRSRDMVFEISYSTAGPCALNGAWVDATLLAN